MGYIFKSPGRINLIGEHTDFNGGYVLPAAIDRYTYLEFEESESFEAYSVRFKEHYNFEIDDSKEEREWLNYVKGAFLYFENLLKKNLRPWRVRIDGNLPVGSGLSSSASLIVGIIYALSKLEGVNISRKEIAKLSHRVETEFVGVNCGIMDQFAVAMGKENCFILIDTMVENLRYIHVDNFPMIAVIDSGIRHRLVDGGYNVRQQECRDTERIIGVPFREMTLEVVEKKKSLLPQNIYERALHVINENNRVLEAVDAVEHSDWQKLGELLFESHRSLKELFEVSTEEIDFIVENVSRIEGVYGARIIGGGFGGSVLVVYSGNIEKGLVSLERLYREKFGIDLKIYTVRISSGVKGEAVR